MSENLASYLNLMVLLIAALILAWFFDLIIRKILHSLSIRLTRKSKTNFDNFLVANKVPRLAAHIIPLLILFEIVPIAFIGFEHNGGIALKILQILFVVQTLFVVKSLFRSTNDY